MRWIGYVAAILWWSDIAGSLNTLNRGHSYKISPKPCRVPGQEGIEGTCMFVWECIKSEGTHVGVCVDTFMFGSCCVHDNSTIKSVNLSHASSSNTLRPSLADALGNEPTRPTLTSISGLSRPYSSYSSYSRPTTYSSSTRPPKPFSSSIGRPSQKRPHAKPTVEQDNRQQTPTVPKDDSSYWEVGSQNKKRPQSTLQGSHDHQQITKTQPESPGHHGSSIVQQDPQGAAIDQQSFVDRANGTHNTLVIRLPSKNQSSGSNKGQHLRPQRPGHNQRPSGSRPDDSKTEDSDLAVQETMHLPSVNSVDGNESADNSRPSLNLIYTERPQWATKPAAGSNKPSVNYSKPYFVSLKTTTQRPISLSSHVHVRPNYSSKPANQSKPTKASTTPKPTYYSSQSTSAAGSVPQTVHWQITTEPAFVTKQRPSSMNPTTIMGNVRPSGSSSSHFWSDNSWTPPRPTAKPHWTDNPTLIQNGPESFPQRPSFKPTEPHENTEYHKPLGSAHYITTSYIETSTKPRPTKKTTIPTTTTTTTTTTPKPTTTTAMTTTTTTESLPRPTVKSGSILTVSAVSETKGAKCGIPSLFPRPVTRIVGGKDASFGKWPWQVSVRRTSFFGFSSTHRCGGAVLNENWIATAGHCVDDLLTSQIRIRVGEYDFSSVQERLPFVERSVAKKVVHPKYNFFTYEYDLALVRLESPLTFNQHILPICLPGTDDLLIGQNATVTGWGRLSEGGTLPSVLQEVSVPIVSNDRCKSMFLRAGRHEFIPDIFLCAGYEHGGQDSCQGDSGGPLQVRGKDGRYFLAGIISWGIGCAEANLPGVCTRISKFVPWILKNVI